MRNKISNPIAPALLLYYIYEICFLSSNRNYYSKEAVSAASADISDNSIATGEKREPKDEFEDLQNVILELDTRIQSDKVSGRLSTENEDAVPVPTLGELIGIKPR